MNTDHSPLSLKAELDPKYGADSNLQHLLNIFEGYRSEILRDEERQPYSPGSARDASFQRGRELARTDAMKVPNESTVSDGDLDSIVTAVILVQELERRGFMKDPKGQDLKGQMLLDAVRDVAKTVRGNKLLRIGTSRE